MVASPVSHQQPGEPLRSEPPTFVAALVRHGEGALTVAAALGWVAVIEQLTRTLLDGYGWPAAPLGGVWALLWLAVDRLRDPKSALLAGVGGAAALLAFAGAGAVGIVLAPMAAAGWVTARHLLARMVPPGSVSLRVRLFLTTILLGIFALLYFQWLALLVRLAGLTD